MASQKVSGQQQASNLPLSPHSLADYSCTVYVLEQTYNRQYFKYGYFYKFKKDKVREQETESCSFSREYLCQSVHTEHQR